MLSDSRNLKDIHSNPHPSLSGDGRGRLSYMKTNKLITALYMVTDILDKEEPLRNKLRTLGSDILSDIYNLNSTKDHSLPRINEIISFLDIASAINLISEMNCGILKQEFLELKKSIKEFTHHSPKWLEEFIQEDESINLDQTKTSGANSKGHSIGHLLHTRIGVQKGSTLMKALSDKTYNLSNTTLKNNFELKKQRRNDIIFIIKDKIDGATITDIRLKAHGSLTSCSEKTLQRELISMVKNNVLKKKGEKRWSRYFLS